MREFLQTAIPVVLTALLAGQVAVTRTGRLRKDIRANIDLLGTLSADDPSRATLEAHNRELVDMLVRCQRRRLEPFTKAGVSFGANVTAAGIMLATISSMALQEIGVLHAAPKPGPSREKWQFIGFYTAVGLCFACFAFRAWRRQRREHPTQPVDTVDMLFRPFEPSREPGQRSPFSPLSRC